MDGKSTAISYRWRYLLYVLSGNLIAAVLFNPPAPARAYEGILEMFGHAAQSLSGQTAPESAPSPDPVSSPTGVSYNRGSLVTEAEFKRLGFLNFPQSRAAMNQAIGYPLAASYGALDGYEEHRLYDGRLLTVTYRSTPDSGWSAIATEVR